MRNLLLTFVSSRAPVWGASYTDKEAPVHIGCFKSCPRVGGISSPVSGFTSLSCFKSCPRVGGIVYSGAFYQYRFVSSRAPVWGASARTSPIASAIELFQVVPPCGGHPVCFGSVFLHYSVSSRAPVWGASPPGLSLGISCGFQVVPPCGGHPAS